MKFVTITLVILMLFCQNAFAIQIEPYNIPENDILVYDSTVIADFLCKYGVFLGSDKGYELDKNITRAEAVTLIIRLSGITPENAKMVFSDVPDYHWAYNYINYAKNQGIINGINENEFAPDREVTGVEFMKISLSMLGYRELTIDNTLETGQKYQLISNKYLEKITSDYVIKRNDAVICMLAIFNTENSDGILQKDLFVERKNFDIENFNADIVKANDEVVFLTDFVCSNMMQFKASTRALWYFCIDKKGNYYVAEGDLQADTVIYNDPVTGKQIADFIPKKNNITPDEYFAYIYAKAEVKLTKEQLLNIKHFVDEVLLDREYDIKYIPGWSPPIIYANICGGAYSTSSRLDLLRPNWGVNFDVIALQNELIGLSPIKVEGRTDSVKGWTGFKDGYESGELLEDFQKSELDN